MLNGNLSNMKRKFGMKKEEVKSQRIETKFGIKILYFIYINLLFIPIGFIGVTCNDDLQWRMYATQGFRTLAKMYFEAAKVQGRVLSCTQIIPLFLAMFPHTILQGIMKIVFIFSNIWLIGLFLDIFFEKRVKSLWMVIMPFFIQITINHCPPDAFATFITFPMSMFLISLICFNKYLVNGNKVIYILSLICYLWAICSYEYFIVLSPLFLIVSWNDKLVDLKSRIVKVIQNICGHVITGVMFLVLYFMQRIIFPSNYEGNKLVFSNIKQSLNIECMIIKSGIPGGYYFSPKGIFLNNWGKELLSANKSLIFLYYIRIIFILVFAGMLLFTILKRNDIKNKVVSTKKFVITTFVCAYLICIPPLLNAFSLSWSYIDDFSNIQGTTVSYLISLVFLCFITVFCYWLKQRARLFLLGLILVWGVIVQRQNMSYAYLQNLSYTRILNIEKFVSNVGTEKFMDKSVAFVEGIEQPFLMQCAPISYWNQWLYFNNIDFQVTNSVDQIDENTYYMKMYKDLDTWIVSEKNENFNNQIISNEICVYTSKPLNNSNIYALSVDGKQILLDLAYCGVIQDYFYYDYKIPNNKIDVQTIFLEEY